MKGTSAAFEMQVQYLKAMYEEKIPFNKILGSKSNPSRAAKSPCTLRCAPISSAIIFWKRCTAG
jgi:hypothetical protein